MYSVALSPSWHTIIDQTSLDIEVKRTKKTLKNIQSLEIQFLKKLYKDLVKGRNQLRNTFSSLILNKLDDLTNRVHALLFTAECQKIEKLLVSETGEEQVEVKSTDEELTANSSYYIKIGERTKGVYKPRLQARGAIDSGSPSPSRRGIPAGEEAVREELASALDEKLSHLMHKASTLPNSNFGVPPTKITAFSHPLFGEHHQNGSYQKYVGNCKPLEAFNEEDLKVITLNEWMKIVLIDFLTLNTDRHLRNLLISLEREQIFLIDHGGCFPEFKSLDDITFDWMFHSFAQQPIPSEWCELILKIDEKEFVNFLKERIELLNSLYPKSQMRLSEEAVFLFVAAIAYLKKGVSQARPLTIFDYALNLSPQNLTFLLVGDKISYSPGFSPYSKDGRALLADLKLRNDDVGFKAKKVGGEFKQVASGAYRKYKQLKKKGKNLDDMLHLIAADLDIQVPSSPIEKAIKSWK